MNCFLAGIQEEKILAKAGKTFCSIHRLKPVAIEKIIFQPSLTSSELATAMPELNPAYLNCLQL